MTAERPICPFCTAPWSDAMLAQYDRYADHSSCSCSAHAQQHVHDEAHEPQALPIPTEDLCCESCSRPIYRAPIVIG